MSATGPGGLDFASDVFRSVSELSGQIHHRDKLAAVALRRLGNDFGYSSRFLDHYVIPSVGFVVPGGNSNHRLVGRQISPSRVSRDTAVWMYMEHTHISSILPLF